jgi:predicted ArsR family transcriptional regulator
MEMAYFGFHELAQPTLYPGLTRVSDPSEPRDTSLATVAVLGEETRRRLYTLVRAAHRPISREEAAAAIGISRKLAAFHLDKLVSAGLLQARYDPPIGGRVGRAPKTYEPSGTDIAISIPARRHDLLADILLEAVNAAASGEDALAAVTRIARLKGAEHGASGRERLRPGRLGAERALTVASKILDEVGCEPHRESMTELRLRNCPFYPLSARAPDVVCAVSEAWLTGLLEGLGVTTVEVATDPDPGTCCTRLIATQHREGLGYS